MNKNNSYIFKSKKTATTTTTTKSSFLILEIQFLYVEFDDSDVGSNFSQHLLHQSNLQVLVLFSPFPSGAELSFFVTNFFHRCLTVR